MNTLVQFGGFLLVVTLTVGPVLALMLLLNARDRRKATMLDAAWRLALEDLRDQIAIQIHSPLLSRHSVVAVDMCECSRDEVWEAIARWYAGLPPRARLVVNGSMDRGLQASFTVETACRRPLCRPQHASVSG